VRAKHSKEPSIRGIGKCFKKFKQSPKAYTITDDGNLVSKEICRLIGETDSRGLYLLVAEVNHSAGMDNFVQSFHNFSACSSSLLSDIAVRT
jgi:hypothetical protein